MKIELFFLLLLIEIEERSLGLGFIRVF